jgi:hypothetical protein
MRAPQRLFGVLYELRLLYSSDLLPPGQVRTGQVRKAKSVGAKPSAFHNLNRLQINL